MAIADDPRMLERHLSPDIAGMGATRRAAMSVAEARALFSPEGSYLSSATYGLPPRPAFEALQRATDEWRHGRCAFDGWDASVGLARASFARLHGTTSDRVAVGSQVSPFVGLIAASLEPGAHVLAPQ